MNTQSESHRDGIGMAGDKASDDVDDSQRRFVPRCAAMSIGKEVIERDAALHKVSSAAEILKKDGMRKYQ